MPYDGIYSGPSQLLPSQMSPVVKVPLWIQNFESEPHGSQRPSIGVFGVPPRRSFPFDVAPEGALETKPAFKGFTLGEWTSIDIATQSWPGELSESPSGSATDSGAASADAPMQHLDEDGTSVGLGLIGPVTPLTVSAYCRCFTSATARC